jgi:hypothetical protein
MMIRLLWLLRYPDGVSQEEGDAWYLGTHAQEVRRSQAYARYVTWRPLEIPAAADTSPGPDGQPVPFGAGQASRRWHRVTEMGFRDVEAMARRHVGVQPYSPAPWGPTWDDRFERVLLPDRPEWDLLAERPFGT